MTGKDHKRLGGILFLAAGLIFFGTAAAMHQAAFYGVGVAFVVTGIVILRRHFRIAVGVPCRGLRRTPPANPLD